MNGKDLIEYGYKQGPHFKEMLERAELLEGMGLEKADILPKLSVYVPEPVETIPLRDEHASIGRYKVYLNTDMSDPDARENFLAVVNTMDQVMRTPFVQRGAIMPDACPAGPIGTIPVGGIVASERIHPGMHSADICCSMYATVIYGGVTCEDVLDAVHGVTHFGGRDRTDPPPMPLYLEDMIMSNRFTMRHIDVARRHFGTQGDGNHFAFVGKIESGGSPALVTHHGSRGFGAHVYKQAMKDAEAHRREVSPETLPQNAWMPDQDTAEYFEALQIVRAWTEANHRVIHDMAMDGLGVSRRNQFRLWNEHNFVFQQDDGLYYHAKGATPAYRNWHGTGLMSEQYNLTLIPMNMNEPILIAAAVKRIGDDDPSLMFAPHGAGRNMSRTKHMKRFEGEDMRDVVERETQGIDARFFSGVPDISELPTAYKDAKRVIVGIKKYRLTKIVNRIMPHGCIMAGEQPWDGRRRKKQKSK